MSSATFARKISHPAAPARAASPRAVSGGLRIGDVGDACEREADHLADEVMAGGAVGRHWSLRPTPAGPADSGLAPPIVHDVLHSPGRPLDGRSRAFFESRVGQDLSRVRIHTDARASESAHSVRAAAYSAGSDIVFANRMFAPHTFDGRRLIAHELAHVLQQGADPAHGLLRRQPAPPGTTGALDPDDQAIVDAAQREVSNFKCNVGPVISGILRKHFPDDVRKVAGTGCETALPGLRTEFSATSATDPKLTRSVPMMFAGKAFLAATDAAHLQNRIADVAKEIEGIDAWRLSSFLIDDKDLANPKITGTLRSMSASRLIDYRDKTKNADVKRYVENLVSFSTPTQSGAAVDPLTGDMTMMIGNVNVVIHPDVRGAANVKGGDTSWSFHVSPPRVPGYDTDKGKVKNYPGFTPVITVEITSSYEAGIAPEGASGYGRGTTPEDIRNNATAIRVHEGSHGEDAINFIRQNPYPVFAGKNDMKATDFETAKKTFNDAETAWGKALNKVKLKGDCVGTTIDQFHKGEKGYKNICP